MRYPVGEGAEIPEQFTIKAILVTNFEGLLYLEDLKEHVFLFSDD